MLVNLKGIFTPQAVAESLKILPPLETTIMDSLFKQRPTHQFPVIGVSDLVSVVQTVPVVRRDGTPIALKGETASMEFIAPLPVKVKIPVTASELNDLKLIFGNQAAVAAWRTRKVEQIRQTLRNTTEAMCAVVAATGKLTWPVELEGGRRETYEVDYGPLLSYTPDAMLTADSKLPDVYKLLRGMELTVKQAVVSVHILLLIGIGVAVAVHKPYDKGKLSPLHYGYIKVSVTLCPVKVAAGKHTMLGICVLITRPLNAHIRFVIVVAEG